MSAPLNREDVKDEERALAEQTWRDDMGNLVTFGGRVVGPDSRPLDVDVLARALDNLWESRWGPLPMPKGQTTVNLEYAEAIAAEYTRLIAATPEPTTTGDPTTPPGIAV